MTRRRSRTSHALHKTFAHINLTKGMAQDVTWCLDNTQTARYMEAYVLKVSWAFISRLIGR